MTNYQSYEEAIKAGAKGADTITEPCDRCSGNGDVGYGQVKVYDVRVGAGVAQTCWKCFGNKTQTVRVSSVKARIRRAEKRADEAAKAQAEADAKVAARQAWDAAHPDEVALIAELADTVREQGLAFDLLNSKADIPTSAQIAKLHEIKAQREEREATRRPVVTGKAIQIEGEVISKKEHFSYYGHREQMTYKMVVRDDRGFKVWGSVPSALDVAKGDRVRFIADIDASDREDSFDFGFFKRPRKAELV